MIKLLAAAGVTIGLAMSPALAQNPGNSGNSAKEFAPGQQKGPAKKYAPGQKQKQPGQAKKFAPGQQMHDDRTTGQGGKMNDKGSRR